MPALHEPHTATTDTKDFAVYVRCLITSKPSDTWCNMMRAKEVVFTFCWCPHESCCLRCSIDGHTSTSKRCDRIGGDTILLELAVNDDRQCGNCSLCWTVVRLSRAAE